MSKLKYCADIKLLVHQSGGWSVLCQANTVGWIRFDFFTGALPSLNGGISIKLDGMHDNRLPATLLFSRVALIITGDAFF